MIEEIDTIIEVTLPLKTFLARQPILDRNEKTIGYEILYRSGEENRFFEKDGTEATLEILRNLFCDLGIQQVVGQRVAFINVTRELLLSDLSFINHQKIVLEILEDISVDQTLVAVVSELKEQGFCIALDDYGETPEYEPLLPLVDMIKIDWRAGYSLEEMKRLVKRLKGFGLALLAEKIETRHEYDMALELGFEYFQGFFFAQPRVLTGKSLPTSRMAYLQLLSRLEEPDVEFSEIARIISRDAGLTLKLLKLVNSADVGPSRKIDSIEQAIVLLGERTLRRWISIMVFHGATDKVVPEAFTQAAVRGFFMEEMLNSAGLQEMAGAGFLTGLLSMAPLLTGISIKALLSQIPLHPAISTTLLEKKGVLLPYLMVCQAYERGRADVAAKLGQQTGLHLSEISSCYLAALKDAGMLNEFWDEK